MAGLTVTSFRSITSSTAGVTFCTDVFPSFLILASVFVDLTRLCTSTADKYCVIRAFTFPDLLVLGKFGACFDISCGDSRLFRGFVVNNDLLGASTARAIISRAAETG
jgi:hypothetical protein